MIFLCAESCGDHLGKALAREEAEKREKEAKLAEDKRQALLAQQEQRVRFGIFDIHDSTQKTGNGPKSVYLS